jgi:hypothetical protein
MSKKPASLNTLLSVVPPAAEPVAPAPASLRPVEKATVYLPRAAHKRLKLMAIEHNRHVNDFLQEAVDMMLAKYGQPSLKDFTDG